LLVQKSSAWSALRDDRFLLGDGRWLERGGLDNRAIATILRGALMDLEVAFQTIERQIHGTPDRSATSNGD